LQTRYHVLDLRLDLLQLGTGQVAHIVVGAIVQQIFGLLDLTQQRLVALVAFDHRRQLDLLAAQLGRAPRIAKRGRI
jgi:hypothetical protein